MKKFELKKFVKLDTRALLAVNGGSYCSGASNGTTVYSNPYYGGGSSHGGSGSNNSSTTPINTAGSCSNINLGKFIQPNYKGQKDYSKDYGNLFGKNACAAASLVNEISQIYTEKTGKSLTDSQLDSMMRIAVVSGAVDSKNAFVHSWTDAAEYMMAAIGYSDATGTMTTKDGYISIISIDKGTDGKHDHFVSDIGGGRYYDPWTKQTGNISELKLTSVWDSDAAIKSPYRRVKVGEF